jgi:uncharacterized protein (DUF305 family)
MRTRTSIAALAVSLALLGAACSGDDDDDATATDETTADQAIAEPSEADVEFAQMMIPHHREAVEMAGLAVDRAEDPLIQDIAERIQAAQDPEIEQMTAWLDAWGEDIPAEDAEGDGMDGMDMDDDSETTDTMPSDQMPAEEMAALEAASGAEFDRLFAQMMIEHHQSAIDMASDEIENGLFPEAIELARAIVEAQQAEIGELQDFLAQPQ